VAEGCRRGFGAAASWFGWASDTAPRACCRILTATTGAVSGQMAPPAMTAEAKTDGRDGSRRPPSRSLASCAGAVRRTWPEGGAPGTSGQGARWGACLEDAKVEAACKACREERRQNPTIEGEDGELRLRRASDLLKYLGRVESVAHQRPTRSGQRARRVAFPVHSLSCGSRLKEMCEGLLL
jgi:hypothetical protein